VFTRDSARDGRAAKLAKHALSHAAAQTARVSLVAMSVPRSDAAFCRAHVTWECALVFLRDDEVDYLEEDEELRHDPSFDRDTNTTVCMAC
jgi:hypothetical protein